MTEFELAELLLDRMDIAIGFGGMYFTLVSAYLVVSYLIGDKLSTPQLAIINALYVLWLVGLINAMHNNLLDASSLVAELVRMHSITINRSVESETIAGFGFLLVQFGGLLASLYFMWSVRRSRD